MSQQAPKQVDKYVISNKLLGKGQFGEVYRGYFKDDMSKVVAVKMIPLTKASQDSKLIKLLKREIEILMKLKHDYIVQMYHATRTTNNLYMFLEFCGDGDLKSLIKNRGGRLTEQEAVGYFRQIVEGFSYLYKNGIIHRDIKPANILLQDGKAKISDFGFAKCIDQTGMDEIVKQTLLGTPLYMAPQILIEQSFSCKCDVWSLGMMFYEMIYGKTPWTAKTPYALYQNIIKQPLVFPDTPVTSDLVKDMLRKMLVPEEAGRFNWPELEKHPLIRMDQEEVQNELDKINKDHNMDALLRSVEVNNYYLKKNKVVGIDKTQNNKAFSKEKQQQQQQQQELAQQKQPQKQQSSGNGSSDNNANEEDDVLQDENAPNNKVGEGTTQAIDLGEVQKQYDEQKRLKEASIRIDSYLTFQRNIGIFVNMTTNQVFKFYKEKIFQIPEHLFYRIIFVLQKHQLIGFENLLNIMNTPQKKLSICQQNEWDFYRQSHECRNTLQLIKSDNGFIRPYFKEVSIRTENYLKQLNQEPKIKKFLRILDEDLSTDNKNFEEIYQETLKEILICLQDHINKKNLEKRREVLQILKYIFICRDLGAQFQWKEVHNQVFYLFYETYDNMSEDQLEQEVRSHYSSF